MVPRGPSACQWATLVSIDDVNIRPGSRGPTLLRRTTAKSHSVFVWRLSIVYTTQLFTVSDWRIARESAREHQIRLSLYAVSLRVNDRFNRPKCYPSLNLTWNASAQPGVLSAVSAPSSGCYPGSRGKGSLQTNRPWSLTVNNISRIAGSLFCYSSTSFDCHNIFSRDMSMFKISSNANVFCQLILITTNFSSLILWNCSHLAQKCMSLGSVKTRWTELDWEGQGRGKRRDRRGRGEGCTHLVARRYVNLGPHMKSWIKSLVQPGVLVGHKCHVWRLTCTTIIWMSESLARLNYDWIACLQRLLIASCPAAVAPKQTITMNTCWKILKHHKWIAAKGIAIGSDRWV